MAKPTKITDSLRSNSDKILRRAVDKVVVGDVAEGKRPSIARKIAGFAMTRIATRSVPGAIVVGGVLLAKHLHDRKKAHAEKTIETTIDQPQTQN